MLPFIFLPSASYQVITSEVPSEHECLLGPSSQVPSTASASPLGTGSSRLDRAAYPSLRQLEWLEVCVLAVTTTKWKDSLFLMTAFFLGGGGV